MKKFSYKDVVIGEYLNCFLVKDVFKEGKKWKAVVVCPLCEGLYKSTVSRIAHKEKKCCAKCSYDNIPKDVRRTNVKHNLKNHPLYYILRGMKERCYNIKNKAYPNYGGKGVKVCEDWKDIVNFYNWCMGNNWEKGKHIDRIVSTGDYCPENCRIVDVATNQSNRIKKTSKYQGVYKSGNKFKAKLKFKKETLFHKTFESEMEAVFYRDKFIRDNNLPHTLNFLSLKEIKEKILRFYNEKDFIYGEYVQSKSILYENNEECFLKTGLGTFSQEVLNVLDNNIINIINFEDHGVFIKTECGLNPYGELKFETFSIKEVVPTEKTVVVFE